MWEGATRWGPPIATMAVVSVAVAYASPMFALLIERAGYSGGANGLSASLTALMMILAAPVLPGLLARVGLIPLVLGAGVLAAVMMLVVPVIEALWWWTFLRMGLGLVVVGMFFATEYWLVETSPGARRGRIVAIYSVVVSGSYALGPLALERVGFETYLTYALPAAVILAGMAPIWFGRQNAPKPREEPAATPAETLGYFRSDPLIMWGVVLFGMIEFGAMGLLSVWALRSGLAESLALGLLAWMALGSMLFQYPLGWAADRYDRRRLLALAGGVSMVAPLILMAGVGLEAALIAAVVLWGGMAVSLYSLALTELGARYDGPRLAAGTAAVVLAYGFGAFIAPASFGWAMDLVPPDGLLWAAALVALLYTLLALIRIALVPRSGPEEKDPPGTDSLDNDAQIRR
ncbi:MAG: MFS transporter [Pseudomonadota bacterium]